MHITLGQETRWPFWGLNKGQYNIMDVYYVPNHSAKPIPVCQFKHMRVNDLPRQYLMGESQTCDLFIMSSVPQ